MIELAAVDPTQLGVGGSVVGGMGFILWLFLKRGAETQLAILTTKIEGIEKALSELKRQLSVQWDKYDEMRKDTTYIQAHLQACRACKENAV